MRKLALLAFVLTTALLVPAAYHHVRAGHEQVQKLVAPDLASFEMDGAKVEVTIAHPLVDPGEGLHVELVASGARGKQLAVGVLVYGTNGSEGGRVPDPPVAVAKLNATIKIDAAGNGRAELVVPLRGAVVPSYEEQSITTYTVLAMAPKAADKLDRLHRNAGYTDSTDVIPSYNKSASRFMGIYHNYGDRRGEDATLLADGAIARVSAYTRAMNPAIAIEAPSRAQAGTAFGVAVVVKNPTNRVASGLELALETPAGTVEDKGVLVGVTATVLPDSQTFELKPGETRRFEFRVLPSDVGTLAIHARVRCHESECEAADALTASGTLDAIDIVQPAGEDGSSTPTVVTR
jgi:hypothetical protein